MPTGSIPNDDYMVIGMELSGYRTVVRYLIHWTLIAFSQPHGSLLLPAHPYITFAVAGGLATATQESYYV